MGLKNKLKRKGQHRKGGRSSTGKEGDQISPLVREAKNDAKLKPHYTRRKMETGLSANSTGKYCKT